MKIDVKYVLDSGASHLHGSDVRTTKKGEKVETKICLYIETGFNNIVSVSA